MSPLKVWIKLMDIGGRYWGCHQMPERSFFVNGYQFPVCARCTGIMLGELAGLLRSIRKTSSVKFCLLATLPLIIDGTVQLKTTYRSNNIRRFITGIMFGFGFVTMTVSTVKYLFSQSVSVKVRA